MKLLHSVPRLHLCLSVAALALLFSAPSARAAAWVGRGDGTSWNQAANWDSLPASNNTTPINFTNSAGLLTNQNLGNPFVLNSLQATGSGWLTINGNPLEFQAAAGNASISIPNAAAFVNAPLILTANTTFSGQNITIAGGVSGSGISTVSAGQLTVSSTHTGALINNATLNVGRLGDPRSGPMPGVLSGPTTNNAGGTLNLVSGTISGPVVTDGVFNVTGGGTISGNVSGAGALSVSGGVVLTGTNSYTGGSTVTRGSARGTTNSIQGAWALSGGELHFDQAFAGSMAGQISGTNADVARVFIDGPGPITLSGNNTFTGGVYVSGHLGIGSDTAAGIGGMIQGAGAGGTHAKLSAEGGARTVANPLFLTYGKTDFTGGYDLTFTDPTAKTTNLEPMEILHTSTATTTVGGIFFGGVNTSITVNSGTLVLGAAVSNGFRMDGTINVASGGRLKMISDSFVKLGRTNLSGGTIIAPGGVALATGLVLDAAGTIQGRFASEAGAVVAANGPLTIGDSANFAGFFSNGELREKAMGMTLLDKNQAVLGSLTEVGTAAADGTLTAANGLIVDSGRAITGRGTVAGTNALPKATIINGSASGTSAAEPLNFTGYVKGVGDFTNVTFSGTFSPGLSPAISSVSDVTLGSTNTLVLEIGGLTAGTQHDQLNISGVLALDGTLEINLLAFNPARGDSFQLFDGPTTGTFAAISVPALDPGLRWDAGNLYTNGTLVVVPEPSAALLAVCALGIAGVRRRRAA